MGLKVVFVMCTPHSFHAGTHSKINNAWQEVVDQYDDLYQDTPLAHVDRAARTFYNGNHPFRHRSSRDLGDRYDRRTAFIGKHNPAVLRRLFVEFRVYGPGVNPRNTNAPRS